MIQKTNATTKRSEIEKETWTDNKAEKNEQNKNKSEVIIPIVILFDSGNNNLTEIENENHAEPE